MSTGDLPYAVRSADPASAERTVAFELFVETHSRSIGRVAYLMLGDADAADDLLADVLLAAWKQWDTVQAADHPLAYVRQMVVNMASSRIRSLTRERRRMRLFHRDATQADRGRDTDTVVDMQAALRRLPPRRRACVVLRYAFDLSEREVAEALGITVGTVKSQTSKGAAQLRTLVGDGTDLPARRGRPRTTPSAHEEHRHGR